MIHNLFPTAIGMYLLEDKVTEKELNFVKNLEARPNTGNKTSVENYLFKDCPELKRIYRFVNNCVIEYFTEVYAPNTKVMPYVTQSWANFTEKGQYHHKHEHPNSFISGVFYLSADPKLDKIYFYKNNYQQIKLTTDKWNDWNSESWWFEAETNKLIIFPSNLTHMVHTVESDVTRISIAFNTFLKGVIGDYKNLAELNI